MPQVDMVLRTSLKPNSLLNKCHCTCLLQSLLLRIREERKTKIWYTFLKSKVGSKTLSAQEGIGDYVNTVRGWRPSYIFYPFKIHTDIHKRFLSYSIRAPCLGNFERQFYIFIVLSWNFGYGTKHYDFTAIVVSSSLSVSFSALFSRFAATMVAQNIRPKLRFERNLRPQSSGLSKSTV